MFTMRLLLHYPLASRHISSTNRRQRKPIVVVRKLAIATLFIAALNEDAFWRGASTVARILSPARIEFETTILSQKRVLRESSS